MKTGHQTEPRPEATLDPSSEDDSFKPWSLQRRGDSPAVSSVLTAAQDAETPRRQSATAEPARPSAEGRSPVSIPLLVLVLAWVVGGVSLAYGPFARELAAAVDHHPEVKPALWLAMAVVVGMVSTLGVLIHRGSRRELGLARTQLVERQEAEAKLAVSLREKDALLKEVHHRVKNNMQLITSLLSLQAGTISDGPTLQVFRDFQGRVRTIALISERLYQSRNLAMIDLPEFVTSLAENLLSAHDAAGRVRLETSVEPISLDVDTAVPFGLITNELVTNSLQHAFPTGRPGVVAISLRQNGDHTLALIVRDDGVGLSPGLNFETSDSLGLELVRTLTSQLDGSVQVDQTQGTTFTVVFPQPNLT